MRPVVKNGAMWEGEIVAVSAAGNPVTNFKTEEVMPLAERSKVWIQFENDKAALRGLEAFEGSRGFIEIAGAAGKIAFSVGDRVILRFRT